MLLNVYIKEPQQQAVACVIWMHGLGADAKDMAGLAEQLSLNAPVRHVFIDAPVRPVTLNNHLPMRAWYDILGTNLTDREDREGIMQSEGIIRQAFDSQIEYGFESRQIFLAGFSQGGAMALFAGLQMPLPMGGIIALSSYFPLASTCNISQSTHTPIFFASGQYDPLVLPAWTSLTIETLRNKGFQQIERHEYPMEHSVCLEEIRDISSWLDKQIALITHDVGGIE